VPCRLTVNGCRSSSDDCVPTGSVCHQHDMPVWDSDCACPASFPFISSQQTTFAPSLLPRQNCIHWWATFCMWRKRWRHEARLQKPVLRKSLTRRVFLGGYILGFGFLVKTAFVEKSPTWWVLGFLRVFSLLSEWALFRNLAGNLVGWFALVFVCSPQHKIYQYLQIRRFKC